MEENFSIQKLLVLRKLTRAISDLLRNQMKEHLATLAPLLRPRAVLGDYVQSNIKEVVKGADKAFKDLQALFETIAPAKPFNLPKELKAPIEIMSSTLEMTPMEYIHVATSGAESKKVIITSPLKYVLNYSGFAPGRLKELVADRNRSSDQLKEVVLHYLTLHTVVTKQSGVTAILDALHYPITTDRTPEFGDLPLTYISSSISTIRPPDDLIIQSTDLSGRDVFEEVVNIDDIVALRDPLKDRLIEIVRSHGEDLLPQ
jgi:hypothetical protein